MQDPALQFQARRLTPCARRSWAAVHEVRAATCTQRTAETPATAGHLLRAAAVMHWVSCAVAPTRRSSFNVSVWSSATGKCDAQGRICRNPLAASAPLSR